MRRILLFACSMACIATSTKAHEFWIDPVEFHVDAGAPVLANIRVGQKFQGNSYRYIPRNFRRFEYELGGETAPVPGKVGDKPALNVTPEGEGLMVVIHQTGDLRLTWASWEKFTSFLEHKDIDWAIGEHDARGLSHDNVREIYSRYAKSLIAIGDGAGADIEAGLLTEIIALENPYTGDMSDGIDIRAVYQGAPLEDTQIEVFQKAGDGDVTVFTARTDATGRATIPVLPGNRYMLDAVVFRPREAVADTDPTWESLWGNLTFEVPAGE